MEIETTRFGRIKVSQKKIITLTQGLLGFQEQRQFVLLPHREASPFLWFQSIDRPELAFLVVNPFLLCSDYAFDIPDAVEKELEIEHREQVDVLVLVTIPPGKPRGITANLLGPLVVNVERHLARQVVLDPSRYPVRYPLVHRPDARPQGRPDESGSRSVVTR
jgi:flagellar assembly factor FliW